MSTVAEVLAHIDAAQRQRAARAAQSSEQRIKGFYNSWGWKKCRYNFILKNKERICACCFAAAAHGERMVVAHIKSVRLHPELKTDLGNLMWLCDSCNRGMGRDETDWRTNKSEAAPCA